jgi:hypothetical protein
MVQLLTYSNTTGFFAKFLICFFFFGFSNSLKANYLEDYVNSSKDLTPDAFFEGMSYEKVLEEAPVDKLSYYQSIEKLFKDNARSSDFFFLYFCEQLLDINPLKIEDRESMSNRLILGEFALNHDEVTREFEISADMMFSDLASILNKGFKDGKLDKSDAEIMSMVKTLKKHQHGVSIPVSDLEKGIHHLKTGNWGYIMNRLFLDHPFLSYGGCLFLVILVIRFSYRRLKKNKI